MRKNFGAKPWTYPQPVFIIASYDGNGKPDAMNAAWGGISDSKQISMCLSAGHKTVKNILARKAFTVSMATADKVAECDYVGIVSANKEPDKLAKAGLHAVKSEYVDAPVIEELPMAVESVLTDGNIAPDKLRPITFDPVNNTYRVLGAVVGNAFSDGNKLK